MYLDKHDDIGVVKTSLYFQIATTSDRFRDFLNTMYDSGLVCKYIAEPGRPDRYYVTDKGRKFVRLLKKMYKLLGWEVRPNR